MPDQDSIVKKYEQIIKKLYQLYEKKLQSKQPEEKQKTLTEKVKQIYEDQGKKGILKANSKLNVIMDNQFAQAIINRVKSVQKTYLTEFKKLQSHITFLRFLSENVNAVKFITTREFNKIQEEINKIKNSKNYKFNHRLNMLEKSDAKEDFRSQFFYLLGRNDIDEEDQQQVVKAYQQFYMTEMENLQRKLFVKLDSIICKFEDREELLGRELSKKVDEYLGQQIGKNDFQLQINRDLLEIAEQQSLQSNQEHLDSLNEHYEQIKKILNKFSGMKLFNQHLKIELRLAKFGSIISGFATKNTDMDLTILTNCYINQIQLLKYLQQFLKAEFKQKKNIKCDVKFIPTARIPLLKLQLETSKGVAKIDLIVNNILGVINSRFLAVYGSISWIRQLGVLIKLWAKKNDLVEQQKFSSYSLNLMLLHFLIQTRRIKLIMDAKQRNPDKTPYFQYKRKAREEQQKFRVYFQYKTKKEDVTNLRRVNILEILTQFFQYYSDQGKHWKFMKEESIITVDGSKAKQYEQNFVFTIKDPFDQKHNPGRVQMNLKGLVSKSFSEAVKTIKSTNKQTVKSMFYSD